MKTQLLGIATVGLLLVLLAIPSTAAAGSSYFSQTKAFTGQIVVTSAADQAPLAEAYIGTWNLPTSSLLVARQVLAPAAAIRFVAADRAGGAKLFVLPLGRFMVWQPGYWPEEIPFKVHTSRHRTLDADGTMRIALRPVADAEKAEAARQAAKLFGFLRPDGSVSSHVGPDQDPSEQLRRAMKAKLQELGGLP